MPVADPSRIAVNMGELAVARGPGPELCALGLGSCIGLAVCDSARGIYGLAHVVLPDSAGHREGGTRFADVAVPALLEQLIAKGARRSAMGAWLAGGASMFRPSTTSSEIGARNAAAVRALLAERRVPVLAAETGGSKGRTVRVLDGGRTILVREAGTADRPLRRGGS